MMINLAQLVVLPLLSIVLVLAVFRLARGPNLPDRVVAIDLIGVLALSMIATYALITGRSPPRLALGHPALQASKRRAASAGFW
jgi:multisubunit Na+/H+ antiporter MnhF subunit